ncbi:unnamed protein product [Moneuplotes crassus]|uniref:Transcription elongation factor S-II n=1 Tax=Euplotes crassus TaxID=5936 RepID=A0AAD1XLC4_EUPCR|nr:unnamed protein product [Moneuplotes crassus]
MSGSTINEADTIQVFLDLIKKIEEAGSDIQGILDSIKYMGRYSVNINILKTTKAGKKMTKWTSHKSTEVSAAAKKILGEWKKQINEEKARAKNADGAPEAAGKDTTKASLKDTDAENPPSTPPAVVQAEVPAAPSRVRQADLDYEEEKKHENEENYDEFISENEIEDTIRNKIRKGFEKQLLKAAPNQKKKCKVLSIKIENGIVSRFGAQKADYSNKSRTVLANLMRNTQFKEKIIHGVINPEEIASMDPKEFLDDDTKKKRQEMEKSIVDSKRSDFMIANMKLKEGMYTCGRCKGKKTTFYEQQTRSADEPMTTFVQCLTCGHNMKF